MLPVVGNEVCVGNCEPVSAGENADTDRGVKNTRTHITFNDLPQTLNPKVVFEENIYIAIY